VAAHVQKRLPIHATDTMCRGRLFSLPRGKRMIELAVSPLILDPLTRDYWGHYDAWAIQQLAPLADDECYAPKFYKAPASADELIPAFGYVTYGLRITPGDLIFGFYLPALVATSAPPLFNVQITDAAMDHKFFDEPVPAFFLGNYKPTYLSTNPLATTGQVGSFPNLLSAVHPVVGDGLFLVEIWDTLGGTGGPGGSSQRVELVIGALEVVNKC
jgi:hypothetical protein